MNRFSKLLAPERVLVDCEATDKAAALDLVAGLFADSGIDAARVRASLAAREALGSTGLGQGVAIPHGRVRGLRQATAAVIRLARPVAFDSPDDAPVGLLLALLVPENATQEHLEVLSEIAQMLADGKLRGLLLGAANARSLYDCLAGWEPIRPAA